MAEQLSLFFNQTQQLKHKKKEINAFIKENLEKDPRYKEKKDILEKAKAEMKMIVAIIKDDLTKEVEKLDEIKLELQEKEMMTCDVALNKLIKGEEVKVVTDFGDIFTPEFSVKWKKTGFEAPGKNRKDLD